MRARCGWVPALAFRQEGAKLPRDAMRVPTSVPSAALFASLASVALPRAAVFLAECSSPLITSRTRLLIAIGDAPPQPLTLGLYGEAAPASVALFEGLCAGTLASTLGNKDLSYAGSSVSRIERDKLITGGRSEPRPRPPHQAPHQAGCRRAWRWDASHAEASLSGP